MPSCQCNSMQAADIISKLAKKGTTPSQIGVILRDLHGVGRVTTVTGTKILRILRKQGMAPEIPEDLYFMIKKAVSMRKHLERFRKDRDTKFRLILVESRIHRLARYYRVRAMRAVAARDTCWCLTQAAHLQRAFAVAVLFAQPLRPQCAFPVHVGWYGLASMEVAQGAHTQQAALCTHSSICKHRADSCRLWRAAEEEAATKLEVRVVHRLHPRVVEQPPWKMACGALCVAFLHVARPWQMQPEGGSVRGGVPASEQLDACAQVAAGACPAATHAAGAL